MSFTVHKVACRSGGTNKQFSLSLSGLILNCASSLTSPGGGLLGRKFASISSLSSVYVLKVDDIRLSVTDIYNLHY